MVESNLYERDFFAWANQQAALLRSGNLSQADIRNIAEEIESMGRTEKRELVSRLTVLLMHLLKWQFQPERRGRSWLSTITIQRHALADHLADNPSLKSTLDQALVRAYEDGRLGAIGETDLPESLFPAECPWSFEKITNTGFWPE
ncbi:MAG: DUF29 domain-containing protein [Azospirillaceae bacterium]|nr:DUF29 domain-containing protein [Azospirillaceae bacterium]